MADLLFKQTNHHDLVIYHFVNLLTSYFATSGEKLTESSLRAQRELVE